MQGLQRPAGLAPATQSTIQNDLNSASEANGFQAANQLDIARIPLPAGETLETAVDKGADVYQSYCFGCHGPNQDGNGVNAASLNPKPRNLRDAPFMQAMSYQRIYTSVHKGVPGTAMPRWENSLTETQMKNVIGYVLSLSAPQAPAAVTNTASGGTKQYTGQSVEVSPKPITPSINGNPAAETNTAPPSASGQPTAGAVAPNASAGAPAPSSVPNAAIPGKSAIGTDVKNTGSGAEANHHVPNNPALPKPVVPSEGAGPGH
jgi:mono/diheme cytochrome c family protein